ncbi:unnamed protein product [Urochloa decumbens]|uniref:Replication protein A OB domain-containing protein n=1 Tax=Urochloa decumbens TaxID=240449 RepID=A0ABC9BP73_9POAL
MAFAPLSDLPLGRAHCGVCVRVVRLWDYCGNKEDEPPLQVDLVLVDKKGNRMYGEIPGADADKFKVLIKEGQVYVFRKFIVSGGKPAYKPFPSNQMIRFTPWTTVQEWSEGVSEIPKYVYDLVDFEELPSRAGQVECFLDVIGVIVGVSEIAHVHLPSSNGTTSKRVISLKDLRNNKVNLVLWGNRAVHFDAETVHSIGQQSPVVAVFVGLLVKSYKGDITLSGGSACKWYINEEIPEIEEYFERVYDHHSKVEWISAGEQQFRALERQQNLEEKTLLQLRDIDPWEFEGSRYRCTVTIARINSNQPWWFASCTKCHRASVAHGAQYKCSGGCPCTTAEPKYRLSLIGTDGTATAEFVLFGRVARQVIGKPVVALIRSASKNQVVSASDNDHILPEIAALVSQKFTFSVSVTQKSLSQRNVSFQVNGIVALYGKQSCIPKPLDSSAPSGSNADSGSANRHPEHNNSADASLQKKARLSHMIPIPSKDNARSKAASGSDDEHRTDVLVPTAQIDATKEQTIDGLNCVVHPVDNDESGETASPKGKERSDQ